MSGRLLVLVPVLVAFIAYSISVAVGHGLTGFLSLAVAEPWAMQMLLDLVIALLLFSSWMVRDARERGLPSWPYLFAIVAVGSIGALAYLVHRELSAPARPGEPTLASGR